MDNPREYVTATERGRPPWARYTDRINVAYELHGGFADDGGEGQCRECGKPAPCPTLRALDGDG